MSETVQQQKSEETKPRVIEAPRATTQASTEPEVDEFDFDIDISDLVKESENLAKHYRQKGGQ